MLQTDHFPNSMFPIHSCLIDKTEFTFSHDISESYLVRNYPVTLINKTSTVLIKNYLQISFRQLLHSKLVLF